MEHLFQHVNHFLEEAMHPQAEPPKAQPVPACRLRQFPLVEGEAESCCPICLCTTEHQQVKQLPCGHTYHPSCIDHWLGQNHTCPVCRHSLLTEEETVPTPQLVNRLLETRRSRPHANSHSQRPEDFLAHLSIRTLKGLIQQRGLCDLLHSGMERSHLESLLQGNPPSNSELLHLALERYPRSTLRGLERNELVHLL